MCAQAIDATPPAALPTLVGRGDELSAISGLLHDIAASRGRAIAVRGAAGIGKSALLDGAARLAATHGSLVVRTSASAAETQLPFAGLEPILRTLGEDAAGLEPAPREVLSSAAAGVAWGELPVALALRALLDRAGARRPLLV